MRRATIYRGRVEDVLPTLAGGFDAVLCDPPYGLSDETPESIANRVRRVLSKVMLPDFDQLETGLAEQIDLTGVPLDGSRLSRVKLRRIVEARIGVPEGAVDLDHGSNTMEQEVNASCVAAACTSDPDLTTEGEPKFGEFLGDYILDARNALDLSVHDLASGGVAQFGLGSLTVPVVTSLLPGRNCPLSGLLSSGPAGLGENVGSRTNAGRDQGTTAGVVARLGAVGGAVLRFDLAGRTAHLSATPRTAENLKRNRHLRRPQLVRTVTGASGLSAMPKAIGIRVVVDSADRTPTHFRLWVVPNLFDHLASILPAGGFMGLAWDHAVPPAEVWAEVLRVCKPGAPLLAFGGTRKAHRLACAIEDAGWEVRDSVGIAWCYGQGFPKSLDISKAVDRAQGLTRERVKRAGAPSYQRALGNRRPWMDDPEHTIESSEPVSELGRSWDGYGTALKPSWEPVVLAMAPLSGTFAENALERGVAGLNIDGSRIGTSKDVPASASTRAYGNGFGFAPNDQRSVAKGMDPSIGRWPANAIFIHSPDCGEERCAPGCAVAELEHQSGNLQSGNLQSGFMAAGTRREGIGWRGGLGCEVRNDTIADSGPASRFFYCAKVAPGERDGSKHPTLKPVDLTAYLAKLLLPPARKGEPRRLLVPFSGAGSEMMGALRVGWEEVVGIELDPQHAGDAERRIRADAPLLNEVQVIEAGTPLAAGGAR